jgi:hypothetical protein
VEVGHGEVVVGPVVTRPLLDDPQEVLDAGLGIAFYEQARALFIFPLSFDGHGELLNRDDGIVRGLWGLRITAKAQQQKGY